MQDLGPITAAKGKRADRDGEQGEADTAAERATLWHLPPGRKYNRARFNNHRNHWEFFHSLSFYGLKDRTSTYPPASDAFKQSGAAGSAAARIKTKTKVQAT